MPGRPQPKHDFDRFKSEYFTRTGLLPLKSWKIERWDNREPSWREAQHQLHENICNEIDSRKS